MPNFIVISTLLVIFFKEIVYIKVFHNWQENIPCDVDLYFYAPAGDYDFLSTAGCKYIIMGFTCYPSAFPQEDYCCGYTS